MAERVMVLRRSPETCRARRVTGGSGSTPSPRALCFFFFKAEDGIRDDLVTGVQTCALPIYMAQIAHSADSAPQACMAIIPIALRPAAIEGRALFPDFQRLPRLVPQGHAMTLQTPHATPSSQRPDSELPQDRLRWSALACAALLSACASTPLPPWPTASKPQAPAPARPAPATPVVPQATTQPIAPANNLVPLPYNAAVAARFPDPATRYDTPGLAPQRNQFTTASELSSWLNSQASKSLGRDTRLGIVQPGSSQRGSPIQALVATRAPGIQPSA